MMMMMVVMMVMMMMMMMMMLILTYRAIAICVKINRFNFSTLIFSISN